MIIHDDIYRIAYLVMKGLRICDIQAREDKRRGMVVEFLLKGESEAREQEIDRLYEEETAHINVREYLREVFKHRALMYAAKNKWKTKGEQHYEKSGNRKIQELT